MSVEQATKSHMHKLSRSECLSLLSGQAVGRIAFNDASGPVVLPVNFAIDREDVLVATSVHSSIARGASEAPVAFEVDQLDRWGGPGWSVVVRGWAGPAVLGPPTSESSRSRPWPDGDRGYVIRIRPDVITGRRLLPS